MTELHQLLLDDDRSGAVDVIAHSFTQDVETKKFSWSRDLKHFKRLSDEHGSPPAAAFSFLLFNKDAAIVHRLNTGNETGRNFSHAIVGPFEVLRDLALPLTQWSWRTPEMRHEDIKPISEHELSPVCEQHLTAMRSHALSKPADMCSLLAAVLDNPGMTFSVVGVESRLAPEVLFAVRDIVDAIGGGPEWAWTFSTFETSDSPREYLPEFVFMPRFPEGTVFSEVHRKRVDVADVRGREAMYSLADLLYKDYRRLAWEAFRKEIRQHAGKADTFAERVEQLLDRRAGALIVNSARGAGVQQHSVDEPVAEPIGQPVTEAPPWLPPAPVVQTQYRDAEPELERPPVRQPQSEPPVVSRPFEPFQPKGPPEPSPVPAGFMELKHIQSAKELRAALVRGMPTQVTPEQRRQLWNMWQDTVLATVVCADRPIAVKVETFDMVLKFFICQGGLTPVEIDGWLRTLSADTVFHDQVTERTPGSRLRPPREKFWLTKGDLQVMVATTVVLLIGIVLGLGAAQLVR